MEWHQDQVAGQVAREESAAQADLAHQNWKFEGVILLPRWALDPGYSSNLQHLIARLPTGVGFGRGNLRGKKSSC